MDLVCASHDTLELSVHDPIVDRDEALLVAREAFALAPDIVWQRFNTISMLAASLTGATVWWFWWD
jgi:hypothetical protein